MLKSSFQLFKDVFPRLGWFLYLNDMRGALAGCRTCLDVGCGDTSPLPNLGFERLEGVEAYEPSLERARAAKTHHALHFFRAQDFAAQFSPGQFDCVAAIHVIEHLPKEDGYRLIADMERIASKRIMIITPCGFIKQESEDGDLQEHLSGWEPEEMRALGFRVTGLMGPKWFFGERGMPLRRPAVLWGMVAKAEHLAYTRSHPEKASTILCIKDKVSTRAR